VRKRDELNEIVERKHPRVDTEKEEAQCEMKEIG
jgi:hypothetical protein